jgi:hypothetical protein
MVLNGQVKKNIFKNSKHNIKFQGHYTKILADWGWKKTIEYKEGFEKWQFNEIQSLFLLISGIVRKIENKRKLQKINIFIIRKSSLKFNRVSFTFGTWRELWWGFIWFYSFTERNWHTSLFFRQWFIEYLMIWFVSVET